MKAAKSLSQISLRCSSAFAKVEMGPPDPILGLTQAFRADNNPKKVNLGVGAYRDDNGKPFVLNCVRTAEKRLFERNLDHEYAGITGVPSLCTLSANLLFGEKSRELEDKRVVSSQALSGTGALRVLTHFLHRHYLNPQANANQGEKAIFLPNPTWPNHVPLAKDVGYGVKYYSYYEPKNCSLNWNGLVKDLLDAPKGSIVLLHACAHNPTGVDPSDAQWKELSQLFKEKGHFPFFDAAYQGFASGDCDKDVFAVRQFAKDGHNMVVAQSFAKNFGLYGERVGACHIVCSSPDEAARVESQLKILIRPMYSNPPITGARIVSEILADAELTKQWKAEVKVMADRIIAMRHLLVKGLAQAGSQKNWNHITSQIGMFSFTGLTQEQCDKLIAEYSIYLTRTGRISIAGITSQNVGYLAESMHKVTK